MIPRTSSPLILKVRLMKLNNKTVSKILKTGWLVTSVKDRETTPRLLSLLSSTTSIRQHAKNRGVNEVQKLTARTTVCDGQKYS